MNETLARLTDALRDRYRIDRELGAGGMATVYLAHDHKHDRDVAVKVLRPELGAVLGAERFLSEIKVTANLQHPNLLPLFDSGEVDGLLYYVMPYIEGETLRARLQREQQLPVDDTLRLVTLMAGALDFAHARGVIHRDLKPENILLQAGQPVIADFGIALAVAHAGGSRVTQTGVSLGTPNYMSPEQAAGDRTVDARSDQYALGAITYEMLTGEAPHTGATAHVIIARLMTETPRTIRSARPAVSLNLDAAVQRALSKAPADRFATCGDFARALPTNDTIVAVSSATRRRRVKTVGAALAGVAVVSSLVAIAMLRRDAQDALPEIGRTTQVTRDPGLEIDPALSPDGAMIAYSQGATTRMQIFVQQVTGGRRVALTNDSTDNFRSPQWSPDGTQVAYQGNDGIFVVASLGGAPRRVVQIDTTALSLGSGSFTSLTGVAWSRDGTQLAYTRYSGGLFVVPVAGGEPVRVAAPDQSASSAWAPDGSHVAVSAGNPTFAFGTGYFGNVGISSIWVVPVVGGRAIRITDDASLNASPQWSTDGRTLYWVSDRGGSRDIYQVRVDRRYAPIGAAQRLTTGLEAHGISVSANGSHLAYSSFRTLSNIWSIAVPGNAPVSASTARAVTTGSQTIEAVDVSADGQSLVFDSDRGGNPDIYRMPARGGEAVRLTTDSAGDFSAAWSRNGKQIAFHSVRGGNRNIYTMNSDGTGLTQRTSTPAEELDPVWSPDGSTLAYQAFVDSVSSFRVLLLSGGERGARTIVSNGDFLSWSPVENVLAYHAPDGLRVMSSAGGPSRLVVGNIPDGGEAFRSAWSPNGTTLYYLSHRLAGWAIRAVPLTGGSSRALVNFDDPTRQPTRYGFTTDGRMFYFTLGSNESDVWVMKLTRRR